MSLPKSIRGVIEGFYGRPWNARQRHQLFAWMQAWGLNTYFYAPKDDLKHRARWRELYDEIQTAELAALLRDCQRHGLEFVYGIAPGQSLLHHSPADQQLLAQKLEQLISLGTRHFALLFDDIPLTLADADATRFGSPAAAQSHVANALLAQLRARLPEATLMFCPTVYCERMAGGKVTGNAYLAEIGRLLDPAIQVLWTGPEIIAETISPESIRELAGVLRRPPVIWDNLFANDYDGRRLNLGPYSGRSRELLAETGGILCNFNCEFESNFVPLKTFAEFLGGEGPWEPRPAFEAAISEWQKLWLVNGEPLFAAAELALIADCLYLPYHLGDRAREWVADLEHLLAAAHDVTGATRQRFERTCAQIAALFERAASVDNRELLHAVYRPWWALKEEALLLGPFSKWQASHGATGEPFRNPDYRPKVYRGGIVSRIQELLPMDETGDFYPRPPATSPGG